MGAFIFFSMEVPGVRESPLFRKVASTSVEDQETQGFKTEFEYAAVHGNGLSCSCLGLRRRVSAQEFRESLDIAIAACVEARSEYNTTAKRRFQLLHALPLAATAK